MAKIKTNFDPMMTNKIRMNTGPLKLKKIYVQVNIWENYS